MNQFDYIPNDKTLGLTKFKALADDNSHVAQMMELVSEGVQNIVGKGEITGISIFSFVPLC